MTEIKYTLIRSDRKTIAIQIKPDGIVIVRAPKRTAMRDIERFVKEKESWIHKHIVKQKERDEEPSQIPHLTEVEIQELAEKACKVIPERVKYYAPLVGVTYGRITIRNQKTRWGSCSSKGNLNFNCLLMLAPMEVIDSVVVHELCHRKQMNHSKDFYKEVYRVYPDYDKWHKWLNDHGNQLMQRMH